MPPRLRRLFGTGAGAVGGAATSAASGVANAASSVASGVSNAASSAYSSVTSIFRSEPEQKVVFTEPSPDDADITVYVRKGSKFYKVQPVDIGLKKVPETATDGIDIASMNSIIQDAAAQAAAAETTAPAADAA